MLEVACAFYRKMHNTYNFIRKARFFDKSNSFKLKGQLWDTEFDF